ncbi:MAG: hypothetical protein ACE5HO_09045 [bacterium]
MPQAVYILWAILLVVVVLALPFVVMLLHRTFRATRSIARYFDEMETAGFGIAEHTGNIKALEDTIRIATAILNTAGDIDTHAHTIETTLAARAGKMDANTHRN